MKNKKGFFISLALAVLLPWLLILITLMALGETDWMVTELSVAEFIGVLSFNTMGYTYDAMILGYGFWIPLLIWIITGLVCGVINRSPWKGLLCTLLGLVIHLALFLILLSGGAPVGLAVDPTIQALFGGLSMDFFMTLIMFLGWYSLILPGGFAAGLFGGAISRFRMKKD